jgi:urease accessory protein
MNLRADAGITRRGRVHEDGSLRVRFPNVEAGAALEAVLVNTAGGMTGGDRFAIEVALDDGANAVVGTAAAEKIYRSTGLDTEVAVTLTASAGATLAWLPQETILFDRARLARRIDVGLADDASLLLCEAVVFGRAAMGETVTQGRLVDRWRLCRGGRLVFAETMRLDGAIAAKLAAPAVAAGAHALATLLVAPGNDAIIETVRSLDFAGEVGVSAWNGLAVVRCCARDGAALRHDIIRILTALGRCELPRLWLS